MGTTRRNFLKVIGLSAMVFMLPVKAFSEEILMPAMEVSKQTFKKIIQIIDELQKEGSNIVLKTLNGKKYIKEASAHYPNEDSIEDKISECQIFFHAHRKDEYGHFHTFSKNEDGELVHLIMISMDKKGRPIALSTLNRWVTGDFFVNSDELKKLIIEFEMNHDLFPDKRIIEFIENIFLGYNDLIFELFEERDESVINYVRKNTREPFEDRDIEILSTRKIDVYQKEWNIQQAKPCFRY